MEKPWGDDHAHLAHGHMESQMLQLDTTNTETKNSIVRVRRTEANRTIFMSLGGSHQ